MNKNKKSKIFQYKMNAQKMIIVKEMKVQT